MTNLGTRLKRSLFVSVLTITVGSAFSCRAQEKHGTIGAEDRAHADVGSQMVEFTKQGKYEQAVQVGLRSLKNQPSDESIYQQVADVYLIRAKQDPSARDQWVAKAILYTGKALALNSRDTDAAGAHLFQIARSYESAGDLSASERCSYYMRARSLLEDRESQLTGDQITLQGKTFPLAPLRDENKRVVGEINAKAQNADCR